MSSRSEKLLVELNVAAKVAKIEKKSERSGDDGLCSVDLLFANVVKHGFEFDHEVQRRKRPGAELMLGIYFVESASAKAGANGSVEVGFDTLLLLELRVGNGVCDYAPSLCIGSTLRA